LSLKKFITSLKTGQNLFLNHYLSLQILLFIFLATNGIFLCTGNRAEDVNEQGKRDTRKPGGGAIGEMKMEKPRKYRFQIYL